MKKYTIEPATKEQILRANGISKKQEDRVLARYKKNGRTTKHTPQIEEAMKKKTKKQNSNLTMELIGGIFIVETFPDGREKREEVDGAKVLNVLVVMLENMLNGMGDKK
jgi:hypothetical protein